MAVPRMGAVVLAGLGFLAGCRTAETPPYARIAPQQPPMVKHYDGRNAYDDYEEAAQKVAAEVGTLARRNVLFEAQREKIRLAAVRVTPLLARARSKPCEFRFVPTAPFERPPFREGWRVLGQGLEWAIQRAVQEDQLPEAIRLYGLTVNFGVDIAGGSAVDASLGYAIAERGRLALLPAFGKLSPRQLEELENATVRAFRRLPPIEQTMANEHVNMLFAIQAVQDAYRDRRLGEFETQLGSTVRDAIDYLNELRTRNPKDRVRYFEGFVAEAKAEELLVVGWGKLPANGRPTPDEIKKVDEAATYRPWRRLARHFLRGGRSLLPIRDLFLARNRLFIQEIRLARLQASGKGYPTTLPITDPALSLDPFSGDTLKYRRRGVDYDLYSVGPNLRDDGGETNADFTGPDLVLERIR